KSVIGRISVQGFGPHHAHASSMTAAEPAAGYRNCHVVTVSYMDEVGSRATNRQSRATVPGPAIVGNQSATTRTVGVILAVARHNGRRIVNPRFAVQG